jgi:hypothetical protein
VTDGDQGRAPQGGRNAWKGVAVLAVVSASLFAGGWVWLRAEERDCEWECFNFPAVAGLLALGSVALISVVVLIGMLAFRLIRDSGQTDQDPQTPFPE